MPTYDYHCLRCKKTYELRESFSAPERHRCQACGSGTAKRILTAPRIVFKGSGWYVNDSRTKTSSISEGSEGSSSDGDAGAKEKPAAAESKADGAPAKAGKAEAKSGPAVAAPASASPGSSGSSGSPGSSASSGGSDA